MVRWAVRRRRKRAKARFKVDDMTARQLAAKVGVNVRTVVPLAHRSQGNHRNLAQALRPRSSPFESRRSLAE